MKKRDLESVLATLNGIYNLQGVKFSYGVIKNKNLIQREIDTIKDLFKPQKGFMEYQEKRIKLCQKFSRKDEKGNYIYVNITPNNRDFAIENQELFDKELEKLQKEYRKEIDFIKKQGEEMALFLDEDVNIKWHKIPMEIVPENITPKEMDAIIEFVEEAK